MRLQAFIEMRDSQNGYLSPPQERKRKAVCRDWWKMVLWYVRLRRAANKQIYHTDLLKAERMAGPCSKIANPIQAARNARLNREDSATIQESKANESNESEVQSESEEEDLEVLYRNETAKYRSATAKREFFSGMRFQLRIDSFQVILNSLKRQILRESEIYPNWHFICNNICMKAGFNNEDVAL